MSVSKVDELQGKHTMKIFSNILKKNEEQIPWKYEFFCTCEYCISYFFGDFENSTFFLLEPQSHQTSTSKHLCENSTQLEKLAKKLCSKFANKSIQKSSHLKSIYLRSNHLTRNYKNFFFVSYGIKMLSLSLNELK